VVHGREGGISLAVSDFFFVLLLILELEAAAFDQLLEIF
jgi:hypothetical protein